MRNKIDDLESVRHLAWARLPHDGRCTVVFRRRLVHPLRAQVQERRWTTRSTRSLPADDPLADFEHLVKLLEMENPASWIPSLANLRSPTQVPSRPSRAVLKDLQVRMDWFLRVLLAHPTFATHEMLWEFFLVPDLQLDTMEGRSKLKAETRAEKVRDELEPIEEAREVEQFVDHARDIVRSVRFSTRGVARRSNVVGNVTAGRYHQPTRLLVGTWAELTRA